MPAPAPAPATADDADKLWSASAIVGSTTTGHHVLHVEGYSHTKDKTPTGKAIRSQPFRVGGHSWRITYYPNGSDSMSAAYVSFFLYSETPVKVVKARAKFSLLDRNGELVLSHTKTTELNEFSEGGNAYGFDFIKRELLEASEHLKDDSFKIRCDVTVTNEIHTEDRTATTPFVVVPPSDMHMHFNDLLATGKGADVAFQVAGETFRAHRLILGARSPLFKAELLGVMRESTATGNPIRIDDMLPQVFKALLHFIYTDSLPEMEEQAEEAPAMAQHLLEAADRYHMPRLKLICEEKLCNHLEVSTAATTLVLAEQHDCQGLKEACIEFLKSPDALESVMKTDGFEHLTISCPALVKELLSELAVPLYKRRKLRT